jgi:hypothetical protein
MDRRRVGVHVRLQEVGSIVAREVSPSNGWHQRLQQPKRFQIEPVIWANKHGSKHWSPMHLRRAALVLSLQAENTGGMRRHHQPEVTKVIA